MYTAEDIKNDFENALRKAQTCTTSEEARELYNRAPYGSIAENVYRARWEELANAEAPARAQACTTSKEAVKLYNRAPYGSVAKKVYEARLEELVNIDAKAKPEVTPDDAAEQAFYIHNVTKDIERLTRGELEKVIADLKPETLKRMCAAIVDHRS